MKFVFGLALGTMILASVVVWLLQPASAPSGKTPIVWTSDDNPLRQDQIQLFNRLNPALALQLDPANQGMEKVIVQALAGVGPDLFDCRDANQLSAYVKAGIALDLTDDLRSRGIDVPRDTWPCMSSMCVLEGRVYGVPTNAAANAVWFNRSIFDAAGIPYPKGSLTWKEFLPLAQRLTVRDASGRATQYGFLMDWWYWKHFLLGFGGTIFSPDGTRCTLGEPAAVSAIQLMHDLVYKYRVTPSPNDEASMATQGGWGSGTVAAFGAGRGAMALGGRWWLATLRPFPGLRLGVVESPYGTVRAYGAVGRATLVNKNGANVKRAMDFLVYMAGPEYNRLIDAQADGIAPFKRFAYEPEFLHDSRYPDETYNDVWRSATERSLPVDASPFVNGQVVETIVNKQLDLVKIDAKSPHDAMAEAARQIDEAMQETLQDDPTLRAKWQRARGGSS